MEAGFAFLRGDPDAEFSRFLFGDLDEIGEPAACPVEDDNEASSLTAVAEEDAEVEPADASIAALNRSFFALALSLASAVAASFATFSTSVFSFTIFSASVFSFALASIFLILALSIASSLALRAASLSAESLIAAAATG